MTIWIAKIDVMLKPTVNDPPGLAIRDALRQLGFGGVSSTRAGKHFEIRLRRRRPSRRGRGGPIHVRNASSQPCSRAVRVHRHRRRQSEQRRVALGPVPCRGSSRRANSSFRRRPESRGVGRGDCSAGACPQLGGSRPATNFVIPVKTGIHEPWLRGKMSIEKPENSFPHPV